MTRVVNLRKTDTWDVYVGRSGHGMDGYFGNPIQLRSVCPFCHACHASRGGTLLCFEDYARYRIKKDKEYRRRVRELAGKTLACFCKPGPCHADVLAELADELATEAPLLR